MSKRRNLSGAREAISQIIRLAESTRRQMPNREREKIAELARAALVEIDRDDNEQIYTVAEIETMVDRSPEWIRRMVRENNLGTRREGTSGKAPHVETKDELDVILELDGNRKRMPRG